jgi:hypothetical protein
MEDVEKKGVTFYRFCRNEENVRQRRRRSGQLLLLFGRHLQSFGCHQLDDLSLRIAGIFIFSSLLLRGRHFLPKSGGRIESAKDLHEFHVDLELVIVYLDV